jgi:hypothetical protein
MLVTLRYPMVASSRKGTAGPLLDAWPDAD